MKLRRSGLEVKDQQKPRLPRSKAASGTDGSARDAQSSHVSGFKRFLKVLGPGFITGASDDDPSGIGTYSTAGASLGFATLWLALITFPLMAVVQFICAEVG